MPTMLRVRTTLGGWTGSPGLSTFYFEPIAPPATDAMAAEAVGRVRTFFDSIKTLMSTAWTAQVSSQVDTILDTTGELTGSLNGGTVAVVNGAGGSSAFGPPNIMLLGQLRTSQIVRGRTLKGRTYVGPVVGAKAQFLVPQAADITTLSTALSALRAPGVFLETLVVWSRPTAPHATDGSSANVVSTAVWGEWAQLRSRRD